MNLEQEFVVALGLAKLREEKFDRLLLVQGMEDPAQRPDDLELLGRHEQLLLAGAGRVHVHRGEDALVGQATIELELHVSGALELLEDHLVHTRPGLHEGRGDDRQRAAVLDVACGTEESLGWVQGCRVDATGKDATGGRGRQVVGATEAGHRVEQYDNVMAELHKALCALDGEFGDSRVILSRTVEGGGDDLTLHRALHVGDFLRALVNQHDHEVNLGIVGRDCVGDGLHHHRLAGLGGRHDESALALADRSHEIDHARGEVARGGLQAQSILRIQRRELGELRAVAGRIRIVAIDRLKLDERSELLSALAFAWLPGHAGDSVTLAKSLLANHRQRDIHIVVSGEVAAGAHEGVVVEDVQNASHRHEHVVLIDVELSIAVAAATSSTAGTAIAAVAESITTATAATAIAIEVAAGVAAAVAADYADSQAAIAKVLPRALGWIALGVLILLFMFTGSIILPIKAVILNVVSLSAMLGAMTWVFIDGHLGFLVGKFTNTGTIDTSMAILISVVTFGLSMDYELFLLSRIKEEHDLGKSNVEAVATGLQRSARIITAAALLLAIVFAAFITSGVTSIKELGFGVAFAIILDATLIRALLVPALMRLFGERNWWAPKAMKRFTISH